MQREQNDFHVWIASSYAPGRFQSGDSGHRYIHQNHFWFQFLRQAHRVLSIVRFRANFPFRKILQDPAYSPPDERVVIHDQNARHCSPLRDSGGMPSSAPSLGMAWRRGVLNLAKMLGSMVTRDRKRP